MHSLIQSFLADARLDTSLIHALADARLDFNYKFNSGSGPRLVYELDSKSRPGARLELQDSAGVELLAASAQ